ncbi:MAG: hypothetical protein RL038_47, partial [Actinomycetota bacterium]
MSFSSTNRRPARFESRDGRPGGRSGGRSGGRPGGRRPGARPQKPDIGSFRGKRLEITENTPFATEFAELGVPNKLAQGLGAMGILEPFPIQAATIGDALAGKDVLGRGRTGSGKTLAFGLPLMARLMSGKTNPRAPRGMILVPTRELAQQVYEALAPLGDLVGLNFVLVIGGAKYDRQIQAFRQGADIVVATPGRLEDLIERGDADLSEVEIAVLDEADQMADMGFLPIVDELMSQVPAGGQRLLFSATLDRGVDKIVNRHLENPVEHATEPNAGSVTTMEHHVFLVQPRDKFKVIRTIATRQGRCIAFVRTQAAADDICEELLEIGVTADALHGGKSQAARNKALQNLKNGRVSVLVATDVAARGIHVDDIDLVLNIDLPRDFKDYLHRAGRTARAGANGLVVSISTVKQSRSTKQLMQKAGVEPEYHHVDMTSDILSELTGAQEVIAVRPSIGEAKLDRSDIERARPLDRQRDERRDERPRRDDRREDRPRRDDRFSDRPRRDDRFSDRPVRDDRREERPRRDDRFSDRPVRDDRRDDRPRRDERFSDRPRRDDRPARDDRFSDRPRRDDRPARDDRFSDRPRRDDRPVRDDRREERPRRDDRFSDRSRRDDRRDDRPARKPRFASDDRPSSRLHSDSRSGERRGRDDREGGRD